MSADITKAKTWYGLKLGKSVSLSGGFITLTRVPGGWTMRTFSTRGNIFQMAEIFIPFSDEFDAHRHKKEGDK